MLSDRSELLKQQRLLYINKKIRCLISFMSRLSRMIFIDTYFLKELLKEKGHYEDNKPNAIAVAIEKKYKENGIAVEL